MKIKLGNREGVSEDEIFVLGINNEWRVRIWSLAHAGTVYWGDEGEWITEPTEEECVNATASDGQNVPIVIVLIGIQVICHVIGVVEVVVAANDGEKRTWDNWLCTTNYEIIEPSPRPSPSQPIINFTFMRQVCPKAVCHHKIMQHNLNKHDRSFIFWKISYI